ncbi:PREDICTED: bZIP transcription factor 60 [Tarenaya hassleriana]|uniref:bZIP transcription factor 60 n=1 Tax=Tarenaya hassleriana TaxID=28532 RepID=UPI00053C98B0|nr:PREDICTED: bZIP transcription factor 60 [Tarenaya hassleriana]
MADEIDCLDLFVDDSFFLDFDVPVLSDSPVVEDFSTSSPDSVSPWIGQIESMLMKDDDDRDHQACLGSDEKLVSDFLGDILVDSPPGGSSSVDFAAAKVSDIPIITSPADGSGTGEFLADKESDVSDDSGCRISKKEVADVSAEKNSAGSDNPGNESSEKESLDGPEARDDDEEEDDSVAKKRRRQLRNRDAAVRSRERKKIYLKDLETKSKYLERECMRLGRVLQCFMAENQHLRLFLQKGHKPYDASIAKQESAVLLWESLLLVSLLWYLWSIIICQSPQPRLGSALLPPQANVVEASDPRSVAPKGRGISSKSSSSTLTDDGKSRRCKASRPRMKPESITCFAI